MKPNLLSSKDLLKVVTTHPEIVRVIIKLATKAGAIPYSYIRRQLLRNNLKYRKCLGTYRYR
ncbi:MAG: hypothetical protein LBD56_00905 [Endomicrobium sp.]|nr:hypothetical protein [Endomicrobium sp.]